MPHLDRTISRPRLAGLLAICLLLVGAVSAGFAQSAAAPVGAQSIAVLPAAGMAGVPVAQPLHMPKNAARAALIKRGEYLAVAGDCQYCHSVPGGTPFAGGNPLQTPFGAVYSPNITPDKADGIGNYTNAQFWNVLHRGIAPWHCTGALAARIPGLFVPRHAVAELQ